MQKIIFNYFIKVILIEKKNKVEIACSPFLSFKLFSVLDPIRQIPINTTTL